MLSPGRKKIDEVLGMSQKEIAEYLRETDENLQPTDSIQILPFAHGIKALYYHTGSQKPFKTRVYLKNLESSDSLK